MYLELARKPGKKGIGEMFARLAREELAHKHRIKWEYDDIVPAEM